MFTAATEPISGLPIVDVLVDENDTGSNENGFGYDNGGDFFRAAFQAWSWLEYQDTLFIGLQKIEGGNMIYYTDSASEEDGAWALSMGGIDLKRSCYRHSRLFAESSAQRLWRCTQYGRISA